MITAIEVENFKGVRERVRLDFRPITLLFGANSAGKSTILHALHYAREVFERHNLDADQTIAGGKYIDLGGFEHFVHRRDKNDGTSPQKLLRLRVDLNVSSKELPSFDADIGGLIKQSIMDVDRRDSSDARVDFDDVRALLDLDFDSLVTEFSKVGVEVAIGWSAIVNRPFVATTTIYLDDAEVAQIKASRNVRGATVRFSRSAVNVSDDDADTEVSTLGHPCLKRARDAWRGDDPKNCPYTDETLLQVALSQCGELLSSAGDRIELSGRGDALPGLDGPLEYDLEPFSPTGDVEHDTRLAFKINLANQLVHALSGLIIGPCQLVRNQLKLFRYLGPLRDTPPRNFQPPRFPDPSRWSSGLGAWDALYNGGEQLVDAVGDWLGDPENLNAGCRLERRTYYELDRADPLLRSVLSKRAFDESDEDVGTHLAEAPTTSCVVIVPANSDIALRPHDVGIGISQIVPVIVSALDGDERLVAIEQPELHIHPRLQAEVADLFVEAIRKNKHCFIIETHSEHLILRLLRRIRETENGKAPANRQLRTDDLGIYYLKQENGCTRQLRIDVDVKGEFIQPWPDDFFEIDFYERFA